MIKINNIDIVIEINNIDIYLQSKFLIFKFDRDGFLK